MHFFLHVLLKPSGPRIQVLYQHANINKGSVAGQQILIPLTESLYVAGHVYQKESLLVSIGTGYYAEVRMRFLLAVESAWKPCDVRSCSIT